jgi:hypothetical protein
LKTKSRKRRNTKVRRKESIPNLGMKVKVGQNGKRRKSRSHPRVKSVRINIAQEGQKVQRKLKKEMKRTKEIAGLIHIATIDHIIGDDVEARVNNRTCISLRHM